MKRLLVVLAIIVVCLPTVGDAQGIPLRGNSGTLVEVNANRALLMDEGVSASQTYAVTLSSVSYTVAESLINLEAESGRGFRISQICMTPGSATAAGWTTWQLIRSTTASSGGTVITAENTTTHTVSKMDPGDSNWSGVARTGGTEGTSGAVLDQGTIFVPITATPPATHPIQCREYGLNGGKLPTVVAGTSNGVKLMFTAAAGGATQSAMIRFIACTGTPCI
jgi:hypothetical protein